jgi:cysteine peptidase C11 family protein
MAVMNGALQSGRDSKQAPDANRHPRKWTVMVFMGADTVRGNEPLARPAESDIREIRSIGGGKHLDIFVEVHHVAKSTQRYRFAPDGSETEEELEPSEGELALIKFIKHSILTSGHRRDDHSMLVLWGHAYDFAFARARTRTGIVDSIDFVGLSEMLRKLQDELNETYRLQYGDVRDEPPTLDIIGFDACDIATVEMACQLHPFAKYLLGSEIGIPMPGWPYDLILDRLMHPYGRLMTPPEFGSYVVRSFCASYTALTPVSLTFLDLRQATRLRKHAEFLALTLSAAIDNSGDRDRISDAFKRSQTGDERPYVDVVDLCLNLRRAIDDPFVGDAARLLGDLLLSPRSEKVVSRHSGRGLPLIVEHGRNAGELARLNGISLYAPHVASRDFEATRGIYEQFVFARDTLWSKLVHLLADFS